MHTPSSKVLPFIATMQIHQNP